MGISQSRHSRRIEPISRSQNAVGLWRPHWGLQPVPAHRRDRPVDRGRKDVVPIVEDEPVGVSGVMTMRNCWIVHSAGGCSVTFQWGIRRVPTSRTTNIEDAEAGRYHREEVTGHDRVRMIPHKRRPALESPSTVPRLQPPDVPTHRARRHGQSQFEEEFVRDPFFTPGRVRLGCEDRVSCEARIRLFCAICEKSVQNKTQ
jgi:hypothetical protein